jgi:hypothetical protein
VWVNPANDQQSSVPRLKEVNDYTARAICLPRGNFANSAALVRNLTSKMGVEID